MTDVSHLDDLARKIASSSPNIRRYAIAQAAATQAQELELQALREEVELLKGSGAGSRPGGSVPVNTVAPAITGTTTVGSTLTASTGTWSNTPTAYSYQWSRSTDGSTYTNIAGASGSVYVLATADSAATVRVTVTAQNAGGEGTPANSDAVGPITSGSFGASLPSRIAASSGTNYYVATNGNDSTGNGSISSPWLTIQKALDTVSLTGSIINVRAGTYVSSGNQLTWSRAGNSGNPVTLQAFPGEVATISQTRLLVTGSYLHIDDLVFQNPVLAVQDCLKLDSGAHHIDIDGCTFTGAPRQGLLLGSAANQSADVQIWNCRIHGNGGAGLDGQDHGVYAANVLRLTIGNCLIYGNTNGYGLHLYPDLNDVIVTACTVDDHTNSTAAGGGSVVGTSSGTVTSVRYYGCLFSNQASSKYAIEVFNTVSSCEANDCLAYIALAPLFETSAGMTYTNCPTASTNPLYVNQAGRDYRLQSTSPAIGHVQSGRYAYLPSTDIDGNPRVTSDAGCYAA